MTSPSPPPLLPPIRSLGIDFPSTFFASDPLMNLDRPAPSTSLPDIDRRSRSVPPATDHLTVVDNMPPSRHPSQEPAAVDDNDNDDDDESYAGDNHENHDDENDDDEDSENDGHGDHGDMDGYPWRAINEDTSVPCADEIVFIESKEEFSATDHAHWEKQTFFDLDDADLKPGAAGRIEWSISNFNGTKEKPNKQLIMKSPIVRIGDYDWQIKLYPKGNRTEFLSLYVECLSISKPDFVDQIDFKQPPLPVLAGNPRSKRRVSLAAQLAVVMYNPAEPRVYEHKADAHQFHKQSPDHGWKYFSREPRYDFHYRRHGQRQAILRNDSLAFTAYIRLVQDSTGCMWDTSSLADNVPSPTTLRPLENPSARTAAYVILFHYAPFRKWLYHVKATSQRILMLQHLLHKFLSRKMKRRYLKCDGLPNGCDVVSVWQGLRDALVKDGNAQIVDGFDAVLGGMDSSGMLVGNNRLKTGQRASLREAVADRTGEDAALPLLAIELERQHFNQESRQWEKVCNAVTLDNKLTFAGLEYHLFAAVVTNGKLGSGRYVPYVRPGGLGGLWYAYEDGITKCLTSKAASDKFSGREHHVPKMADECAAPYHRPNANKKNEPSHAYLAMYVRKDIAATAFLSPAEEAWQLSDALTQKLRRSWDTATSKSNSRRSRFDDVKVSPTTNVSPATGVYSTYGQHQALVNHSGDLMDGDDVIMSDVEDNLPNQTCLNGTLQASTSAEHTLQKCINYYSGESYDGTTLPDGRYHGRGHLISTNGDDYDGDFKNGKPHGHGTMIYSASGDQYVGSWENGLHHGHGKSIERKTGNIFTGGWKEGRKHGKFVLEGEVTEDDKQYCQICYDNEMNVAFYDCGHVLACKKCAGSIQQCPVCRKQVLARLELFGVRVSMQ